MKKTAIVILSLLLVLAVSCDLQFSNEASIFDDVKPEVKGDIGKSEVVGADVVIHAPDIADYTVSSWIVTYRDRAEENIKGEVLTLPIEEAAHCTVMPVYTVNNDSAIVEGLKKSTEAIGAKVFNKITPSDGGPLNLTAEELSLATGVDSFYVNLGKVADNVTSLGIGNARYEKEQVVRISIGMNAFLSDVAFKVDENGNLLVNSVALYFANVFSDSVVVNDEIELDYSDSAIEHKTLEFTPLGFVEVGDRNGVVSEFTKVDGDENALKVTLRCGTESFRFAYEGDNSIHDISNSNAGLNTGDASDDILLIRSRTTTDGKTVESLGFDVGKEKGTYFNGWYYQANWDDTSSGRVSRRVPYSVEKEYIVLSADGQYKGEFAFSADITPMRPSDGH